MSRGSHLNKLMQWNSLTAPQSSTNRMYKHTLNAPIGITASREKQTWKLIASYATRLDRQYLVFVVLVLAAMYSIGQIADPFIAHDDYDWLISQSFGQGFESPWSKALSEGRWIAYLWSLVSIRLSGYEAFSVYLLLYSCLSILMAKVISNRGGVMAALLMFFAPMGANTMQWPVTQIPAVMIFCVAFFLMANAKTDQKKLAIIPLSVIAGFSSYPALLPVLFLLYGASYSGSTKRGLLGILVYGASYVAAVLVAFTLNYIFQDHFGITPAPWRAATPLFSTGTLQGNVARYLHYYDNLKLFWLPIVIGIISYAICLVRNIFVRQCTTLLAYSAVILCMEASLCILSGVDLPMRSSFWLWIWACAPAILLLHSDRHAILGLAASTILLIAGATFWQLQYANIRAVYPAMRYLGQQISQAMTLNSGKFDSVVIYGDARANPNLNSLHSNRALRNFLFKEYKIYTQPCAREFCEKIPALHQQDTLLDPILLVDRKLVVVVSRSPGDAY